MVLNAVQESVIGSKGHVSPSMRGNIDRLLANLDSSAYLLTKLAQRSFLKLYLHADETQRKIDQATDDLLDMVMIFQVGRSIVQLISGAVAHLIGHMAGRVENRSPERRRDDHTEARGSKAR